MHEAFTTATGATATPFNGDFYGAVAAVIPVLFLAIAVQGPLYQDLMNTGRSLIRAGGATGARKAVRTLGYTALWYFGYFTIVSGIVGELIALIALSVRRDNLTLRVVLLGMTGFLLLGVAIGPLLALTNRTPQSWQKVQGSAPEPQSADTGDSP